MLLEMVPNDAQESEFSRSFRSKDRGKSGGGLCYGYDVVWKVDAEGVTIRGTCSNSLTIKRQEIEERVLAGLKDKLLTPEMAKVFVAEFQSEMNRLYREREVGLGVARAELREVGHKIEAILKALEDGIYTPSTKDRLLSLEARKKELEQQLDSVSTAVRKCATEAAGYSCCGGSKLGR